MKKFKFVDLFSGIGGFHQAMIQLGGECVFASEIDDRCKHLYEQNYQMSSDINIRDVEPQNIPVHDVLCAGFPCQTFSKAGNQKGLTDSTRGTLFFEIERILSYHKTKYIILENVRNLVSHDKGNTWRVIHTHLQNLGYRLTEKPIILSPHQFGIPQLRERVFIVGIYDPENSSEPLQFEFKEFAKKESNSIYSILSSAPVDERYNISSHEEYVLNAWDEFYQNIDQKVIGFPVWSQYFKCTTYDDSKPEWYKLFIQKNIQLYLNNKEFIDRWLSKHDYLRAFTPTQRKFEWQAGTKINSIWDGIIQFRPSGIRVKAPSCFPALVAIVQIPVIGKYRRRLTVQEAARLQSFPENFILDANDQQAYKQLGNSVNVEVVKYLTEKLLNMYPR